jgi:hypothetical protein
MLESREGRPSAVWSITCHEMLLEGFWQSRECSRGLGLASKADGRAWPRPSAPQPPDTDSRVAEALK